MVSDCKASVADGTVLGQNAACSRSGTVHYSFDFAQQVHFPSDALQPGPMYFCALESVAFLGFVAKEYLSKLIF